VPVVKGKISLAKTTRLLTEFAKLHADYEKEQEQERIEQEKREAIRKANEKKLEDLRNSLKLPKCVDLGYSGYRDIPNRTFDIDIRGLKKEQVVAIAIAIKEALKKLKEAKGIEEIVEGAYSAPPAHFKESEIMLERLVKPILDIYNEMEILQMEGRKKDEALAKEYEKKEARLQNEKDKIYTKVHQLGDKHTKLRKELGVSMRKAKCPMTTTEIDGVLYGICSYCGVAIIQQMTDTKEAEKLLAIDRLEKSK
jgi:hypothetical protein